jgi:membrane-associated protease RseP (regulator of RpoE activity)
VFLRIQTLWDETMADTAARALTAGPDAPSRLVVMAGANHVRYGFGIPRRLFRRVPLPYVVLTPYPVEIPESKRDRLMDVDLPDLPLRVADFYWGVGYADLEGDRVMLGVRTEAADGGGVRVIGVTPESPAAGAGIEAGDVIVAVDGEKIETLYDLTYQVGLHKPGDRGPVVVKRNGEEKTLEVTYDVAEHGP